MSLISAINLSYQAGSKPLFNELSFNINHGDRIGLVGHNGCGKSTLIQLITGDQEVDDGRLVTQKGLKVGLVEQFLPDSIEQLSAFDAVIQCLPVEQHLTQRYQVDALLEQLGINEALSQKPMLELSGGQKNLVLFARAIIQEPELLLLDEPGNHMDSTAMQFLKRYLNQPEVPAFIMISHDRDLLDSATDRTLWLRDLRCYSFELNYTEARLALQEHDRAAQKTREAEEKEIGKLKASAKRLANWGKVYDNEDLSRKAKSMEKRVDKLEADVTFVSAGSGLSLSVDAELIKAKQIFVFDNETVASPGGDELFSVTDLKCRPGDRIALLGINGSGKSSCIKALLSTYATDTGEQTTTRFNPNVRIGYFDQELTQFELNQSMTEWVRHNCKAAEEGIRRALIHWGFPYAEHGRSVSVLSGGEKARLLLLTFQLDQPNFLIMDEPTNHIDLQGKEELEESLISSEITLLFTSHDQRFIENIATRFWWIHDGGLVEIHDPDAYFQSMEAADHAPAKAVQKSVKPPQGLAAIVDDEEAMLERIIVLEELLEQDLARKAKFQKPAKQTQWKEELASLSTKLG